MGYAQVHHRAMYVPMPVAEKKPETKKGCASCGAPWEPTCSYCKAVNFSALCAKGRTP
jgi:hypothetical protein